MTIEQEMAYFRDSGSTAYDRWLTAVEPWPDAEPQRTEWSEQ